MKPIPVEAAKAIADAYGYQQVVIVARSVGEGEHVTTYGTTKRHCAVAARIGDYLKYKIMGWNVENDVRATDDTETAPKAVTGSLAEGAKA